VADRTFTLQRLVDETIRARSLLYEILADQDGFQAAFETAVQDLEDFVLWQYDTARAEGYSSLRKRLCRVADGWHGQFSNHNKMRGKGGVFKFEGIKGVTRILERTEGNGFSASLYW